MIAGGITPRQNKFETNKEKLRQTIRAALSAATSFEDFSSLLLLSLIHIFCLNR